MWHGQKKKRMRKEKVQVIATTGRFDKWPDFLNIKEINPEYSLEGLMLKLKFQYFGSLM